MNIYIHIYKKYPTYISYYSPTYLPTYLPTTLPTSLPIYLANLVFRFNYFAIFILLLEYFLIFQEKNVSKALLT